jgi:hypothetical protein
MLSGTCPVKTLSVIKYMLILAVGVIIGFLSCWAIQNSSRIGLRLKEDITIRDEGKIIATINKGALLLQNKYTRQCQLSFYIKKAQVDFIDAQDTYYSE